MSAHNLSITLQFPYRIIFTQGSLSLNNNELEQVLTGRQGSRILVLLEDNLQELFPSLAADVTHYLLENCSTMELTSVHFLPGGERAKQTLDIWSDALDLIECAGIDRHSYVLAIGGGAFLDVVGFAAATAHRGVRLVRMPTTTLSQADSGVGVKNGINFHQAKNYLGTFSVPWATLCDADFLYAQPKTLAMGGMIEIIKVALVQDAQFFEWLENNIEDVISLKPEALRYAVERSALLHAQHIAESGDAFEQGTSRPLDFGHWSAHFLESLSQYTISHAEAVAIGIALDIRYAEAKGILPKQDAKRAIDLIQKLNMPTFDERLADINVIRQALEAFREHLGGQLTILLLQQIGKGMDYCEIDSDLMLLCEEQLIQKQ